MIIPLSKERPIASKQRGEFARKIKSDMLAYKGKECKDCRISSLPDCCYDFDHLDSTQKSFGISEGIFSGKSLEELKQEIDKCEVVCANCHRIRTWTRTRRV